MSKIKDQFLSNVSHELRTPLNAINGFTEILQKQNQDKNKEEYLDIIQSSTETLITLVNDILDLSKINSGKLAIVSKPFTLKKTLKEIFMMFSNTAAKKNLKFILKNYLKSSMR